MKIYEIGQAPPGGKTEIAPQDGWEENTLYEVKVAFSAFNPIHTALFFSGFIAPDSKPGGYNTFFHPSYGRGTHLEYKDAHYLEVLRTVDVDFKR